jgi:hypothetical protein
MASAQVVRPFTTITVAGAPATVITCPQTEPGRAGCGLPVGDRDGGGMTRDWRDGG